MRSLLGLKLYGLTRKSHVHTEVCDPGLALFAGLNAVPKRSTLAEYASRLNTTARAFTYVNAGVRNEEQAAEILAFADACEQRNGACPSLLAFDSTLTTYANLATLEQCGIGFLTLRRRTKRVLERVDAAPRGDWRSVRLTNAGRTFQRPRTLDQRVRLTG